VGLMKSLMNKKVLSVVALLLSVVVIFGAVKVVQSVFFKASICDLRDESLPSIADEGDIKAVASALRQRAKLLAKSYDTSSDEEKNALKTLSDGFNRLASEIEKSDTTWTIDSLVSELAIDSNLNSANQTLESAIQQCK